MEERKKRTKNIRRIRSITKSIIRSITRRGPLLQILLILNRVLKEAKFLLIVNAIIDQEAGTVIIIQGLDQTIEDSEEMTLEIEKIGIIPVRKEETPEKEVLRLNTNLRLLKI